MTRVDVPTTAEIGPLDLGFTPWSYYERLAETGEIVWDDAMKGWLVSSYELTKKIALADHDAFESPRIAARPGSPIPGMTREQWIEFFGPRPTMISHLDGDDYNRHHRWWFQVFSPKVLAHWGDTLIEPIANARIDQFISRGYAELAEEYSEPISSMVQIAVHGVPWKDDDLQRRIHEISKKRVAQFDRMVQSGRPMTPEEGQAAANRAREFYDMLMPYVLERRSGEGDDFISMVWRDAELLYGDSYDEHDVLSTVAAAFYGGVATTAGGVGNSLYMLMTDDALMESVKSGGQEAINTLVEEMLRLFGPAEFITRRAKRDVEVGGVQVRKDDLLVMVTGAAGRDDRHYGCPVEIELQRKSPRDHFGFYMGPRTCPGQSLARYQMQRVLKVTLDRLQDLRLDPDKEAPRYVGGTIRRFAPLHVRFTPA